MSESAARQRTYAVQPGLFDDPEATRLITEQENKDMEKERRRQEAVLHIKKQFGRNAILKGLSYADGATQRERNIQIGGHHE